MARVARPTSTTTESAFKTRDRVPSQASRCTVLLEIGIPPSSSEAAAPSSPFKASNVVLTFDGWPRTIALRQLALVQSLVHDLAQGVDPALLGRPAVFLPEPLGERVDRSLESGAGLGIHDPTEVVHAVHLADVEEALLVVLFRVALEPIRIQRVAHVIGDPAQVLDGMLASQTEPLPLIEARHLIAQLVA